MYFRTSRKPKKFTNKVIIIKKRTAKLFSYEVYFIRMLQYLKQLFYMFIKEQTKNMKKITNSIVKRK